MRNTNLYIFDGQTDLQLTVLSLKNNNQLSFTEDEIVEQLNKDFTFDFTIPMNHEDSQYLVDGNRIVFMDKDDEFQEFQIYKTEEEHAGNESRIRVYAEHSIYEINDDIVEDLRVVDGDISVAMDKGLSASRWEVGNVAPLGIGTVNFYFSNGMKNLADIQAEYGGEFKFRVVLNADKTAIEHRYVDILTRRGADTNKRFEYKKDIRSLKRTISRDGIKTALYGRGKGEETGDNGYSRKVTIELAEWSKANGDPLDKPLGEKFLGDPEALAQFGRQGGTRHRFDTFDIDSTDPYEILQKTYEQLMKVNKPSYTIEVEGQDLEIVGLTHEAVRIGDTVFIIDKTFKPELRIEARVIEIRRSLSNPENIKVVLGNFLPLSTDIASEVSDLKADFQDRKGVWDTVENIDVTVTDDSIEDITPSVPTNFEATGLFKSIAVEWDFDPSLYIASYEVYASKVAGFTVDSSNLVFRGKAGGYVHKADTNETWYFRIQAVNTHGRKSQLSAEINASTIRIETADFEDLSIVNSKIANLSVDASKMAKATITDAEIKSLNADKIIAGRLKARFVEIGGQTVFEGGYDPSQKADPQDVTDAEGRAKDYAKPSVNQIYDPRFIHGLDFWGDSAEGLLASPMNKGVVVPSDESTEGGYVARIQGGASVYSMNPIPVNTERVYRVTFRVRQTVDSTDLTKAKVYAGVVTLNKDLQNITGGAGTHRYCAVAGVDLKVSDDWQLFTGLITGEGDAYDNFRTGTKYVRPMFIVNYSGGDGTAEIDLMDFEDVTEKQEIDKVVYDIDQRTTETGIVETLTSSTTYKQDLEKKASADDLKENYVTNTALGDKEKELQKYADDKVGEIDFSPYVTSSEFERTTEDMTFKFTSSGGVNLLKNSVGFSSTDFWTIIPDKDEFGAVIGSVDTRQDPTYPSGSGFVLNGAKIRQTVSVNTDYLTLSTKVKNSAGSYGYIKIYYNDTSKIMEFETAKEYNYEQVELIVEPTESTEVLVEMYSDTADDTIFSATMLNVGNTALQWQQGGGELYNTNVLMDLNGIKVISSEYNGYTSITPKEFSGYAEVEGEMTRVFSLNNETTEMEKASVRSEISMSPIKVVPVKSASYNGWAFIAEDEN